MHTFSWLTPGLAGLGVTKTFAIYQAAGKTGNTLSTQVADGTFETTMVR